MLTAGLLWTGTSGDVSDKPQWQRHALPGFWSKAGLGLRVARPVRLGRGREQVSGQWGRRVSGQSAPQGPCVLTLPDRDYRRASCRPAVQ